MKISTQNNEEPKRDAGSDSKVLKDQIFLKTFIRNLLTIQPTKLSKMAIVLFCLG